MDLRRDWRARKGQVQTGELPERTEAFRPVQLKAHRTETLCTFETQSDVLEGHV